MPRVRFIASVLSPSLMTCALLLTLASGARAQETQEPQETVMPPAHLAVVDGAATIDRDGHSRQAAANVPFVPGDHLRTTTGRVDVLFPDGTALDVDEHSAVDLQSPTLIRLTAGRVILTVWGATDPPSAVRYQIDTPAASAWTGGAGEYRVSVLDGPTETELAVLRGAAVLDTERGSMPLHAGERAFVRSNGAPSFPLPVNSARLDAFDQWTMDQAAARSSTASADYLPPDLQMYGGTLDRYGEWEYTAPYGYVWYPTVASDAWHWPTHHYGRWEYARNRWYWVPRESEKPSRTWTPAGSVTRRTAPIEAPPPAHNVHNVVVAHAAGASVAVPRAPGASVTVPRAPGASVAVPRAPGASVAVPRAPGVAIPSPPPAVPRFVPSYAGSPRVSPTPAPAPPPPPRAAQRAPPPQVARPAPPLPPAQPREPHQQTPPAPTSAVPRPGVAPPARAGDPSRSSATHSGRGK
jgi:FecR protein